MLSGVIFEERVGTSPGRRRRNQPSPELRAAVSNAPIINTHGRRDTDTRPRPWSRLRNKPTASRWASDVAARYTMWDCEYCSYKCSCLILPTLARSSREGGSALQSVYITWRGRPLCLLPTLYRHWITSTLNGVLRTSTVFLHVDGKTAVVVVRVSSVLYLEKLVRNDGSHATVLTSLVVIIFPRYLSPIHTLNI